MRVECISTETNKPFSTLDTNQFVFCSLQLQQYISIYFVMLQFTYKRCLAVYLFHKPDKTRHPHVNKSNICFMLSLVIIHITSTDDAPSNYVLKLYFYIYLHWCYHQIIYVKEHFILTNKEHNCTDVNTICFIFFLYMFIIIWHRLVFFI